MGLSGEDSKLTANSTTSTAQTQTEQSDAQFGLPVRTQAEHPSPIRPQASADASSNVPRLPRFHEALLQQSPGPERDQRTHTASPLQLQSPVIAEKGYGKLLGSNGSPSPELEGRRLTLDLSTSTASAPSVPAHASKSKLKRENHPAQY
eukprot:2814042-Rhodomonas_salina.3